MKLSVIICVYNTEKQYFEECLKSVRNSTLKDYEILVIDDGSTIDYTDVIKKYEPRYVKTENRGLFASRLFAISIAKGDYVTFVDSDDTVTFNYHQPMLNAAINLNCDVVINDWAFHTERTRYFCVNDPLICEDVTITGDECLKELVGQEGRAHSYFVHWNKLTKKSVLLKAKEELESTDIIMHRHTYSEDAIINFFVFRNAKKVINIHTGYYFYRIHNDQSVNASNKDKLIAQIDDMSRSFDIMLCNIGKNMYAKEIKYSILKWRALMSRTHYSYAKAGKHKELYGYIKDKYKVETLQTSTKKDGELYAKTKLLGDNFLEIDKCLRKIYFTDANVTVMYDKSDLYVVRTMKYIERLKRNVKETEQKTLFVPKRIISAKNRFLHNPLVYN
ncbi:MAG: glycosyltransferase family 2 protein, partial [Clostridia bacterium]|nr:glycosyltransferase family 2 protein [Clostridia bacterium]